MGYGRAGFYGYDILENLGSGRGLRSADRILPEFQHFAAGDEVPISAVARMRFHAIEPDRFLIWTGGLDTTEGAFIWAVFRLWPPASARQAWATGIVWLVLTVLFETVMGRFFQHRSCADLLRDYNLFVGRGRALDEPGGPQRDNAAIGRKP